MYNVPVLYVQRTTKDYIGMYMYHTQLCTCTGSDYVFCVLATN